MTVNPFETACEADREVNAALLAALPPARNVLELGCARGGLARQYKALHPGAAWTGIDSDVHALAQARPHLDAACALDLDLDPIGRAGNDFDLVVCGDVLAHLRAPERLLGDVRGVCTPNARLVCSIPNMSHLSVIERLVRGDIMYDSDGLLDAGRVRFMAPRSAFKMLLDAGWLPNVAGGYEGDHRNRAFAQAIVAAAEAIGVPAAAAELNVYTYELVISCVQRRPLRATPMPGTVSVFAVVADEGQSNLNVVRSPGLAEIGAEIIMCRDAGSAAATFAAAAARASGEWRLMCGDDLYFPRGTGFELLAALAAIAATDAAAAVLGFAGLGVDELHRPFRAGLTVDRRALRDFPAAQRAISLADSGVVMHRDSPFAIDPALGNHLWATDLCLQSICGPRGRFARIPRIPVFHNSVDDESPAAAFETSARALAAKYPRLPSIATSRATIHRDGSVHEPIFAR